MKNKLSECRKQLRSLDHHLENHDATFSMFLKLINKTPRDDELWEHNYVLSTLEQPLNDDPE